MTFACVTGLPKRRLPARSVPVTVPVTVPVIVPMLMFLLAALFAHQCIAASEHQGERSRLLVLTDIEADPDDSQSLIRLLLYANQMDIEGLIATTSVHQKTRVAPETIHRILDAYAKVRSNLEKHENGFPKARKLRALVKQGPASYGLNAVGEGKDTEGSDWIIQALERKDPRPLWVSVWGGANTLAQALYRLKASKTPSELARLVAKLRVYTISDQDDSAAWIRSTFPRLFYVVSPGGYDAGTWTGISKVVEGIDNSTISNAWIAENIQQSHGPMGVLYPDVSYGVEGDTPAWLNLIPNGLSIPERPSLGGWGGRYELYVPQIENMDAKGFTGGVPIGPETRAIWTNAWDKYVPPVAGEFGRSVKPGEVSFKGYKATVWRWRDAFQNDFAARMDWTIKSYRAANHPPVPVLNQPERVTVKSGSSFLLDAQGSYDPDNDSLSFYWFNYPEAGSMADTVVKVNSAENMARVEVIAPQVKQPEQLHFIVQVSDRGTPPLTRYKRVVVTVQP